MTDNEAIQFAENERDKINYRLEMAYKMPCRSHYEKLSEMYQVAIPAMKQQAATRIEQLAAEVDTLQSALAASQRRERLAYLDLKYYLGINEENGVVYMPKFIVERLITLCGPQEWQTKEEHHGT